MATNKKQVLAANSMAKAGWDFIAKRDDVETRPYQLRLPTAELHKALRELDGIALGGMTPFGEAELAAAPRLRVVTRLGVGYDQVDVPALTKRRIPLMVIGTANSVTVAEFAIYLMMTLAKRGRELHQLVVDDRGGEAASSTRARCTRRCRRSSWPAPGSTCSPPSRRPRTTRCSSCPTWSPPPIWPAAPSSRWTARPSRRCRTSSRCSTASRCARTSSTPRFWTDFHARMEPPPRQAKAASGFR